MQYLGRRYYVEIVPDESIQKIEVKFTHSKFEIFLNPALSDQSAAINEALQLFFREKGTIKNSLSCKKYDISFLPAGHSALLLGQHEQYWEHNMLENRHYSDIFYPYLFEAHNFYTKCHHWE
ncbi:hypothetical protein [uncultured Desulfobacter sp.]|uniref:hypothetical protein n=1 Tax=uncultured Desulfobacter sp. TaxID=240139 RepID=UPI0037497493